MNLAPSAPSFPLQPHRFRPTDRAAQRQMFRNGIRMLRAAPPGLAADDSDRRAVCQAAITQFEELLDAAQVSTSSTQPLLLYYAMSQAGRAIAAAWCDDPDRWEFTGHGLGRGAASASLLERTVKVKSTKDDRDAFAVTSQTVGSERPGQEAPLAAIWAALPDLTDVPLPNSIWAPALPVHHLNERWDMPKGSYGALGLAGPKPPTTRVSMALLASEFPDSYEELLQALDSYPFGDAAVRPAMQGAERVGVIASWAAESPHAIVEWDAKSTDEESKSRLLQQVAPVYRFVDRRWLVPRVGGAQVSPFMLWWMLLYGLSMAVRYEPGAWVDAGRVDSSPLAIHIEDAMNAGMDALPQLVHQELVRQEQLVAPS